MIRIDPLLWGLALGWGFVLGIIYFGGLWWTLRAVTENKWSKGWFAISFGLRAVLALVGFYVIIRKDIIAFLFTIGGFFIIRFVMTRFLGPKDKGQDHANQSG